MTEDEVHSAGAMLQSLRHLEAEADELLSLIRLERGAEHPYGPLAEHVLPLSLKDAERGTPGYLSLSVERRRRRLVREGQAIRERSHDLRAQAKALQERFRLRAQHGRSVRQRQLACLERAWLLQDWTDLLREQMRDLGEWSADLRALNEQRRLRAQDL